MTSFAPPSAATGGQVIAKTLKYRENQEHLLRRLGSAVVLHWDTLPDALQDILIDQAAAVEDRDAAAHEVADIEAFVRGAKAIALSKAPPTEG